VKQCRYSVAHSLTVPDRLFHSFHHIQFLHPLDLDVDTGEAGEIRNLPHRIRAATITSISILPKDHSQFPLPGCTLSLL
jgi:hypothetical protein